MTEQMTKVVTDEERVHFLQHLLNGDCDLPDPWKYLDLEAWNIASLAGISVSLKQQKGVLEPLHDFYVLHSVTSYNSKSGNFREGYIFAKLRICEVS